MTHHPQQLPVMTAQGVGLRLPSVPLLTALRTSFTGATKVVIITWLNMSNRLTTEKEHARCKIPDDKIKRTCEHEICHQTAKERTNIDEDYFARRRHGRIVDSEIILRWRVVYLSTTGVRERDRGEVVSERGGALF